MMFATVNEQTSTLLHNAPKRGLTDVCIGLALLLLVACVYARIASHEFITFDDMTYIVENPHVNPGLSWANASWALTAGHASNWHPLTWWSHQLDVSLFGLDAGRHHAVNVVLHAINVVLWFVVLSSMTGCRWPSACVAALVAVHPIHVESVAWASERKDVLAVLFGLLALLAYVRYVRRRNVWRWYAMMLLCMALNLMSKPMLVTLPALLLLLDIWPLRRTDDGGTSWFRLGIEKLPPLALSIASALITLNVQRGEAIIRADALPLGARLAHVTVAYVRYLEHLVRPVGLAHYYPHPDVRLGGPGIATWQVIAAAGVLIVISVLAVALFRRARFLAVGWFWYLGTMVPVIGFVQVGLQGMADRYAYWPFVGLYVAIVWGAAALMRPSRAGQMTTGAVGGTVIVTLAVLAFTQAGYWRDSLTLYDHTLAVTEGNYFVHTGVGLAHAKKADDPALDEAAVREAMHRAIPAFERALAIRPDYVLARTSLGKALWLAGDEDRATGEFRKAVESDPTNPVALYHLAVAQVEQQHYEQAAKLLQAAQRRAPDDPAVWYQLGVTYKYLGRFEEALAAQRKAVSLAPRFGDALFELGLLLARGGQLPEAREYLYRAVNEQPRDLIARQNLAMVLMQLGEIREAVAQDEAVLAMDANALGSLDRLSTVYATSPDPAMRNAPRALTLAFRACELTQFANPPLLAGLAAAQAATGDFIAAAATMERAAALYDAAGQQQQAAAYRQTMARYRQELAP